MRAPGRVAVAPYVPGTDEVLTRSQRAAAGLAIALRLGRYWLVERRLIMRVTPSRPRPSSGVTHRPRDVRLRDVRAFVEQRQPAHLGERLAEQVAEVERGRVTP